MSKENNVRYLTAETPPTDDNSNKVPTTEWVQNIISSLSSGNVATWSRNFTTGGQGDNCTVKAPSGGTWFCWGEITAQDNQSAHRQDNWSSTGTVVSGGGVLKTFTNNQNNASIFSIIANNALAIKIA